MFLTSKMELILDPVLPIISLEGWPDLIFHNETFGFKPSLAHFHMRGCSCLQIFPWAIVPGLVLKLLVGFVVKAPDDP